MRVSNNSSITYGTSGVALDETASRTLFIESADPVDLNKRIQEALAVLAADQGAQWFLVFADLAGGGAGHTFTFWAELANGEAFTDFDGGVPLVGGTALEVLTWMAAQSEALERANIAALAGFFAATPGGEAVVTQSLFAGASQGTRFTGQYLGEFVQPKGP